MQPDEPIHLSLKTLKKAENTDLPLLALAATAALRRSLDELEIAHIKSAREKGASWDDLAEAMGISRQALQQRLKNRTGDRRRKPRHVTYID